jgi:hypothetical protein
MIDSPPSSATKSPFMEFTHHSVGKQARNIIFVPPERLLDNAPDVCRVEVWEHGAHVSDYLRAAPVVLVHTLVPLDTHQQVTSTQYPATR